MATSIYALSSISFLIVACLTPILIWGFRNLKLTQPIRKELPADQQTKQGIPLMAGLVLFTGVVISSLYHPKPLVLFLGTAFLLFSFVGFLDDFKKAAFQNPSGISGKTKLLLQFPFTGLLLYYLLEIIPVDPNITVIRGFQIELPLFVYLILMMLFIVGTSNAINFTDGLDGLLINVAIPTYFFFFMITDNVEVRMFTLVMIGCLLGLLIYNIHPAKAFMGDTGSLAIGGSLSFLAIIEKVEFLIPLLFLIYLAEQCSVILQVGYYKKTKKRLFRMAPIHYHFSIKYGWSENKIVIIFGFVSWICALMCWLLWYFLLQ